MGQSESETTVNTRNPYLGISIGFAVVLQLGKDGFWYSR